MIDPEWRRWMLSDAQGPPEAALSGSDHWDFYSINARLARVDGDVATLDDATAISELLRVHAADSSVWPANPEIVDWYGLRDEDDDLVSLGALVRWESGLHVLASIATVTEKRGRGYAQELTQGIVARARERGIEWLGLGVSHANVAAQRVYQRAGFTLRANFTTFTSS